MSISGAQYDHVPIVRRGRKALVLQMREMVLSQWRAHGHICENYSPAAAAPNCTGDRFENNTGSAIYGTAGYASTDDDDFS